MVLCSYDSRAFAGLVAPGQYPFNVVVPLTVPDAYQTVAVTLNGVATQGNATISVQHQGESGGPPRRGRQYPAAALFY
jgi:hypothetical protein